MANSVSGKKDKQKLFRMTGDVSERFENYFAEVKGKAAEELQIDTRIT